MWPKIDIQSRLARLLTIRRQFYLLTRERRKLTRDLLMQVSTNDGGTCDMWTYFLASGLAFAFLEGREEVGEEILGKIQAGLNAKTSPKVSFKDGKIIGTAITTFHRLTDLKLSTEEATKAVAENTAKMAMYCRDNTNTPVDVSWTCLKFGWDHRYLNLVDHLELRDSETGELIMEYPAGEGGGET
jgi:hypothetical protein